MTGFVLRVVHLKVVTLLISALVFYTGEFFQKFHWKSSNVVYIKKAKTFRKSQEVSLGDLVSVLRSLCIFKKVIITCPLTVIPI